MVSRSPRELDTSFLWRASQGGQHRNSLALPRLSSGACQHVQQRIGAGNRLSDAERKVFAAWAGALCHAKGVSPSGLQETLTTNRRQHARDWLGDQLTWLSDRCELGEPMRPMDYLLVDVACDDDDERVAIDLSLNPVGVSLDAIEGLAVDDLAVVQQVAALIDRVLLPSLWPDEMEGWYSGWRTEVFDAIAEAGCVDSANLRSTLDPLLDEYGYDSVDDVRQDYQSYLAGRSHPFFEKVDLGGDDSALLAHTLTAELRVMRNPQARRWCQRALDRVRLFLIKTDESALREKRDEWQRDSFDLEWQSVALGHVWVIGNGYWSSMPEEIYEGLMNSGESLGLRMTLSRTADTRLAIDCLTGTKLGITTWHELSMLNDVLASVDDEAG